MIPPGYLRVSKRHPCPVCHKPDWCLVHRDGGVAYCSRIDAGCDRLPTGALIELRDGMGWRHTLDGTVKQLPPTPRIVRSKVNLAPIMDVFTRAAKPTAIMAFATSLMVRASALALLGTGLDLAHDALAFPMVDAERSLIGIRLRANDGHKWAVEGSRNGLFMPATFIGSGPVYVCEGPTDTAAMLGLGLDAVGRPFARGGVIDLRRLFRELNRPAVIVSDHGQAGVEGAETLAGHLAEIVDTRIIYPLAGKDAREWITRCGGTRHLIELAAHNAEKWSKAA